MMLKIKQRSKMPIDTKERDYVFYISEVIVSLYMIIFLHWNIFWIFSFSELPTQCVDNFPLFLPSVILFSLLHLEGLQLIPAVLWQHPKPKEFRCLNFLDFFFCQRFSLSPTSDKHNKQQCCYVTVHIFFQNWKL